MRFGPALAITACLCLAATGLASGEARTRLLGVYGWDMTANWFGGFSAIAMDADGAGFLALTDRSYLVRATMRREGGRIAGVTAEWATPLQSSAGRSLTGRIHDSEGLALAPDGSFYVSFEGVHRVVHYPAPDHPARVLTGRRLFRGLGLNKSLEALARDADGTLYALPEGRDAKGAIPVFRGTGGNWSVAFTLPARGGFLPVGADFGPDGRFYLLERDFTLLGFRSRLRRWEITTDGPAGETTLLQTAAGSHDNLEGISVWRGHDGRLRATMIADDNFRAFQRTELVEYALPE